METFIFATIFLSIHFSKEFFSEKIKEFFYSFFLFLIILLSLFIQKDLNIFLLYTFFLDFSLLIPKRNKSFLFEKIILCSLSYHFFSFNAIFYVMLVGICTFFICKLYLKHQTDNNLTHELLLKKSKELNIIRKTSLLLQKTLDYEELIDILLNTLTSKEALNYDRAFLFLYDERMNDFFPCYIKNKNDGSKISLTTKEEELNSYRKLKIPNTIVNPFGKTYDTKEPIVISEIDNSDEIQVLLSETLSLDSFGLLPLIEKNSIKGIIMVDNNLSKVSIKNVDLDNTVSIIHQASTALINSSLYKQSQNMAYTDSLTGLFNKRFLDFSFEQNLSKLLSKELDLALLILDVDYFKNYNDTNGHIAGNVTLKKISELLLAESRNRDIVVRFGGEEFCVLLFNIDKTGALGVAERIRNRIEKEPFVNEKLQPNGKLTVSIGICSFNGETFLEQLMEKADKALYKAKELGRNRIIYYEGENHV